MLIRRLSEKISRNSVCIVTSSTTSSNEYANMGLWIAGSSNGAVRTARTPKAINAIRNRIYRNPVRSQRNMAKDFGISPRSDGRVVKEDLRKRPFKRPTTQLLSAQNRRDRFSRTKRSLLCSERMVTVSASSLTKNISLRSKATWLKMSG